MDNNSLVDEYKQTQVYERLDNSTLRDAVYYWTSYYRHRRDHEYHERNVKKFSTDLDPLSIGIQLMSQT